jgi:type IV pilus assembly protein PilM
MFGLRKKATFGLQIYDSGIKLTGLHWHKGEPQLSLLQHVSFDQSVIRNGKIANEATLVNLLKNLKESAGIGKSDVILSIPTTNMLMRRTKVASLSTAEMRNLIDLEMHSGDKTPFKNPIFDFVRTNEMSLAPPMIADVETESVVKQEEVIVFASPEETIQAYVEAMKQAEILVSAIDISPLAQFRALLFADQQMSLEHSDIPDLFMMIDCFSESVDISIFFEGLPVFIRSVSITTNNTFASNQERSENYVLTLSTELSRVMNYYKFSISSEFRDITTIYVSGEENLVELLTEPLSNELKAELKPIIINGLSESDIASSARKDVLHYCSALGLALKG